MSTSTADTFDFVIAGAGTAGCGLAYRLGEAGYSVCVLEAGPKDTNPYIRIPSGIMKTSHDTRITWRYEMDGGENANNRKIPIFLGKTLGGSSAINGMVYNRGQVSDFDNWAKAGNPGWDYESVLPYFRKSERYLSGGEDRYRGRQGPVPIKMAERRDPLSDRFIKAATETGILPTADYNGRTQAGVSYVQGVINNGKRWSSAHCYLHPAIRKFGVDVRTDALVQRVLVKDGRATGLEYRRAGSQDVQTVYARRCTIVSTGATLSPKLLQLSGIGPGPLLQQFGIPVVADVAGVGENLSDHYSARLVARIPSGLGSVNELAKGIPLLFEIAKWLAGKPSVLALNAMSVFTFCKSDPTSADSDYSLMFSPACLKGGRTRELEDFPGVTGGAWQQRPESRGHIKIRSTNIQDDPIIWANFLDAEIDRRTIVIALKHLMRVFQTEAMKPIVSQITMPAQECKTDEEWLAYARQYGMTSYHPAGTCKMGPESDPLAVVDSRLRMRKVRDLRVIDASVMPTQIAGQLNAGVMMIAEKAAEMLREDYPKS